MYKSLLRFSIFIIIIAILFAIYILLYFNNQTNTIIVEPNEYANILETVHNNIDMYIGKKFVINGYVYVQDDFSENRFVISQNVYINSLSATEPIVVGFLCENQSNIDIYPNEYVQVEGVLDKCIYNELEYPIILINKITNF